MEILNELLVRRQIHEAAAKVLLVANNDGRLRLPQRLFEDKLFSDTAARYARALSAATVLSEETLTSLLKAATEYTTIIEFFYDGNKRIFTALRNEYGPGFKEAYKRSVELTKILSMGNLMARDIALKNVPNQRSSPIYAKIENQKIVLDEGAALRPLLHKEALAQTKNYLKRELAELGQALDQSNVDKRFVQTFKKIQELIEFEDDAGAISLGLQTRAAGEVFRGVQHELSDVLALQISSILTHTSYFVSQYEDWVDFLRNAREYPARKFVEDAIDRAIEDVSSTLLSNSESVDVRIPELFAMISTLLKGDSVDRQNALFAGIRGFENICIVASKYAYEQALAYVRDAGNKARPTLVKIGAAVIIVLGLSLVADFMPVITKAPELHWILENLPQLERINQLLK